MKLSKNHRVTKALAFAGLIFAGMHTAYAQTQPTDPALDKIVEDTADDAFDVVLGLVVLAGVGIYFLARNKDDDKSFTQFMEDYQDGLSHTLDNQGRQVHFSVLGARPNRQVFRNDFRQSAMQFGTSTPRLQSETHLEVMQISWDF